MVVKERHGEVERLRQDAPADRDFGETLAQLGEPVDENLAHAVVDVRLALHVVGWRLQPRVALEQHFRPFHRRAARVAGKAPPSPGALHHAAQRRPGLHPGRVGDRERTHVEGDERVRLLSRSAATHVGGSLGAPLDFGTCCLAESDAGGTEACQHHHRLHHSASSDSPLVFVDARWHRPQLATRAGMHDHGIEQLLRQR